MTKVVDADERQIEVGSRVGTDDPLESGEVVAISDPDGDVDDEGRPFGISPRVSVLWPEAEDRKDVEDFITISSARGPWDDEEPWVCDDLWVVD